MWKLLKLIELPHITTYKRRWVRRVMIIVTFPQEAVRAVYHTGRLASLWWKWDGEIRGG
jgi:hypothetical protein